MAKPKPRQPTSRQREALDPGWRTTVELTPLGRTALDSSHLQKGADS